MESCGGVSWSDLLEILDDLSDCELDARTDVPAVLVVTVVLVSSSSSVVTECCDGVSMDSDWDFVEPPSSSFSRKRSLDWRIRRKR